jgi:hypothetical protein
MTESLIEQPNFLEKTEEVKPKKLYVVFVDGVPTAFAAKKSWIRSKVNEIIGQLKLDYAGIGNIYVNYEEDNNQPQDFLRGKIVIWMTQQNSLWPIDRKMCEINIKKIIQT